MIQFQLIKNLSIPADKIDVEKFVEGLRGEKMKEQVLKVRAALNSGDKALFDRLKKKLPAIAISCLFNTRRIASDVSHYTKVVVLDYDNKSIKSDELQTLKQSVINSHYTFVAFISPSGKGLKILVKIDSELEHHETAFKEVTKYYEQLLKVTFDSSTKDAVRLTFMSYDADVYYNSESSVYNISTLVETSSITYNSKVIDSNSDLDVKKAYDAAYKFTLRRHKYIEGNRHNFMFLLANNANRYGISKNEFNSLISWCDLPQSEIETLVNSAYNNVADHKKWEIKTVNYAKNVTSINSSFNVNESQLEVTDGVSFKNCVAENLCIPNEIKLQLPSIVSEYCMQYNDPRFADIACITMLNLLSGVLDNVTGYFGRQKVFPTLYSLVIAPSGSGKGIINQTLKHFMHLHSLIKNKHESFHRPNGLFLSANTTAISFLKQLAENDGKAAVCTSDIDFMGYAFKYEASNLHATFRSAYSNEFLSTSRDTKAKNVEIENPQLSLCIAGVPEQLKSFVLSAENGLFNRFNVYAFSPSRVWNEIEAVAEDEIVNNQVRLTNQILNLFNFFQNNQFKFKWRDEQYEAMNEQFRELSVAIATKMNSNALINFLSVSLFKISMVISMLRVYADKVTDEVIYCTHDDFDIAMQLVKIHLQHSLSLVPFLSREQSQLFEQDNIESFYKSLPSLEFDRKTAIAICKETGVSVSDRTVDSFLKRLVDSNRLTKGYNKYQKVAA